MLAGLDGIKPDRMIHGYIAAAIGVAVTNQEAVELLTSVQQAWPKRVPHSSNSITRSGATRAGERATDQATVAVPDPGTAMRRRAETDPDRRLAGAARRCRSGAAGHSIGVSFGTRRSVLLRHVLLPRRLARHDPRINRPFAKGL
jgi:hypothetical protein